MMTVLLALALGALSWSFAEYGLHHWNGHLMKGKTLFSRLHLQHHADPTFFAPTPLKVRMAIPVLAPMTALSVWLAGPTIGLAYTIAFAATWIAYEVVHRRVHTHPPRGRYARFVRRHHLAHHFTNPRENHGVTSALWDHVFRTYTPPERIRVPLRLAPHWMLDEAGRIRPEYAEDYVASGPRRRAASAHREGEPVRDAGISGLRAPETSLG